MMRIGTKGLPLIVLFSLAAAGALGCSKRTLKPLNPCLQANVNKNVVASGIDAVDDLFVDDSSASMAQEQQALASEFPKLMTILTTGNDCGGKGGQTPPDPTCVPNSSPSAGQLPCDCTLPDFTPVNLHVGVITNDMGVYYSDLATEFTTSGCGPQPGGSTLGKDAVLQTTSQNLNSSFCTGANFPISPNFLTFDPTTDSPATTATKIQEFSCLTYVGTNGCFMEQQLESALKALTPSNALSPPNGTWPYDSFFPYTGTDSAGQGDPSGANSGFLRSNSLLAIIEVSDEDDCSWTDRALFDLPATTYHGGLNGRCAIPRNSGAIQPVQRYIDGFLALRTDPSRLVFADIGGIPANATYGPKDFDAMLADPAMKIMVESPTNGDYSNPSLGPTDPSTLTDQQLDQYLDIAPSCVRAIPNELPATAFPPRRMVEVAKGLAAAGAEALVTSICKHTNPNAPGPDPNPDSVDFTDALHDIAGAIAKHITGACLPHRLNPNSEGQVPCRIVEYEAAGTTSCDASLGRTAPDPTKDTFYTDSNGVQHLVCVVNQIVAPGNVDPGDCGTNAADCGWFYDTTNVTECPATQKQRITFTAGALPMGEVHLECLESVQGSSGVIEVGTPCASNTDCMNSPTFGDKLECNIDTAGKPGTNTCLIPCTDASGNYLDSKCTEAGLRGFVCDFRTTLGAGADGGGGRPNPTNGYCVDPTCTQH